MGIVCKGMACSIRVYYTCRFYDVKGYRKRVWVVALGYHVYMMGMVCRGY